MGVQIDCLPLGPLETNCYILHGGGNECWLVDPGMHPQPLLEYLYERGLSPSRILLTHGHGDHIAGIAEVKQAYPQAVLCCPAGDEMMLADAQANMSAPFGLAVTAPPAEMLLKPTQLLQLNESAWQVLDTSGHTPGGVSFYCETAKAVLTGDALFAGSIGRTDIPGANLGRLVKNIRLHLLSLPEETRLLPGHGPESTIGTERRTNPFLRQFA